MGAILTPDVGSPILPTDPIVFDVTDADEALTDLLITVRHDSGVIELAHNGSAFTSFFASGSTRTAITNGFHFSIVRAGGWADTKVVVSAYPFAGGGSLINFSSDFSVLDDPPGEDVALAVTGVAAGSYGNASHVGTFTVDSKGRLSAAGQTLIILDDNSSHTIAHLGSGGATTTNAANIGDVNTAVATEATARAAAVAAEATARAAGDTAAIATSEGFATAADTALLASIRQPKPGEFWVYTIDYDGTGNDTTGVPGIATTMAAALAAATPLKTLEKFGQIVPRRGEGATLVVLIKPRASSVAYRNIANTADQDGSWLNGLSGWHFLARGSLDFANDSNDKIRAGFATATGTNAGGYSVVATVRTITVTGTDHVTSVADPSGFASQPTWVFANGGFGPNDFDTDLNTAGITNAGTRRIVRVVNSTTVITDGTVTNETFNSGSPTAAVKSSIRNLTCQLSGGGAPAFPAESGGFSALTGLRIRFKSTATTTALQNLCVGIIKNTTTSVKPMVALPALPVSGDDFVIESPGVTVANLTHVAGVLRTHCLVGFNCTGTTTMTYRTNIGRIVGCHFTSLTLTFGEQYNSGQSYTDEADANINAGYGLRATGTITASSCLSLTVSASAWLGATQLSVGNNVSTAFIGSGCVSVQGLRYNTTTSATVTSIGGIGNATFQRFRITGATIGGTAGVHCGGLGARIFGVDFSNCNGAQIALDAPFSGTGTFYLDDIISPDGNNAGSASPNESCVLRVTGTRSRDGLHVVCGSVGGISTLSATADRDVAGDGGLRARFLDMQRQPLIVGGIHLYGGTLYLGEWVNDQFTGPASTMETSNTGFFGNGPFPAHRVWHSRGNILNNVNTPSVCEPAVADSEANCAQIMGVGLNYVWASGDALSLARAGAVKIEFVAGQLATIFPGQYAYLSEAGGADSGKARVGPPPTGVAVPLGPIQAVDFDTVDSPSPIYGTVNLFSGGRIFVPQEGHAAESVIANPTGSQGPAVDVALGTDSVLGRVGSGAIGSIPISSLAGASVPLAGHAGFSVIGNATTGPGNAADIAVAADSVVGRSGTGNVGSILVTAAGRALIDDADAAAQRTTLGLGSVATQGDGDKGDIVVSGTGTTWTIDSAVVTNAKRAVMAANTLSGNATGSPATPTDLTASAVKTLLAISFADLSGVLQAAQFPALTGDVTTTAGSFATTLANLPQAVLATRTGALTAALAFNAQKLTGVADPTNPQDAATKHYVDTSFAGGVPLVDGDKGDIVVSASGATWTIDTDVVTFPKMQNIPTDTLVGRDTPATGDPETIAVTGGLEFTGSGGIQRSALSGDVAAPAGSGTTTIQPGVVTNAKRANMGASTLSGNLTGAPAAPSDLTLAAVKAALAISFADVTGTLQAAQFPALTGDVTTTAGFTTTTLANLPQAVLATRTGLLTAALSFNAQKLTNVADPANPQDAATKHYVDASFSGGVPLVDGDKGDIVVSSSGAVWTVDVDAVTFPKMQNIPTDTLVGRDTAGTGDPESLTVTGGLEFTGAGGIQRSALTGNVTAPAGSNTTTIASIPFTPVQTALAAATGAVSLNGQALTNIADPTTSQGAATKAYVDALLAGFKWKQPVVAASTTNITLATGAQNGSLIDDIILATGDRFALRAQTTTSENGLYTANASGAPTRSTDADTGTELVSAAFFVIKGTVNADKAFVCTNDTITLGTTGITFVPFASVVGALIATNNLSDLTNVATARTNLGLAAIASSGSASDLVAGTVPAARMPAHTGDVTSTAGSVALTLANTGVVPGTTGDASHVPSITYDAKGRITNVVNTAIAIAAGAVSGLAAIATSGSGADLTVNSVSNAKLAQRGALSVMGNATNGAANAADIAATVDDRVLGRRASALGYFQVDTPMIAASAVTDTQLANGAVTLPKFANFGAFTILGNPTGAGAFPSYMSVATTRTLLGLDATQSLDLFLAFGTNDGMNLDSIPPGSSGTGHWPFWLQNKTISGDVSINGYIGTAVDANLNNPAVKTEFMCDAIFTHCYITARVETWDPQSVSGTPLITLALSKNGLCDSSPFTVALPGVGQWGGGLNTCSFGFGDVVGVRAFPNSSWGNGGGVPHVKFTVHARLTP